MNYREALAWLFGTQLFGIKLGLDNIRRLLGALGVPAPEQRIVHVAGTNGKGSVCAMIDSVCRAAGYRCGLFTSPHLVTFRERIKVNGLLIGKQEVADGLTMIRRLVVDWDPHPTFFEIATALALQHFADARCEIVVLETGMGGRLDATNAAQPVVSVLTPIALDHQKWLGDTIEQIAAEKAGIIKPGVPVVSAMQQPAAEAVIRAAATASDAPLEFIYPAPPRHALGLLGRHQHDNAALALAALRAANVEVGEEAVTAGLTNVEWPARFQRWDDRIVIDGAHNPAGSMILAQTWQETFQNERATILLAVLRDKDAATMIQHLVPIAARVILPRARSERAVPPEELAQYVAKSAPELPTTSCGNFDAAMADARRHSDRILITGSLHFAGEALAVLGGAADELEDCLQ